MYCAGIWSQQQRALPITMITYRSEGLPPAVFPPPEQPRPRRWPSFFLSHLIRCDFKETETRRTNNVQFNGLVIAFSGEAARKEIAISSPPITPRSWVDSPRRSVARLGVPLWRKIKYGILLKRKDGRKARSWTTMTRRRPK